MLAFILCNTAVAQIESVMEHYIVTTDDEGQETFTKADKAEPGDIIEYRVTYKNNGETPVDGLLVTGPIPNQTAYINNSAQTAYEHSFEVSIDHGKTWDTVPVKRTRTQADGSEIEVIIPAEQYKRVRWNVKQRLEAKAEQEFSYRVRVLEQ